jgi:hypothetical protein
VVSKIKNLPTETGITGTTGTTGTPGTTGTVDEPLTVTPSTVADVVQMSLH